MVLKVWFGRREPELALLRTVARGISASALCVLREAFPPRGMNPILEGDLGDLRDIEWVLSREEEGFALKAGGEGREAFKKEVAVGRT